MKWKNNRFVFLLMAIVTVSACGSDTSGNHDGAAPHTPGIQNVNGSLPDTSNTIDLNSSQPDDSLSVKDSIK